MHFTSYTEVVYCPSISIMPVASELQGRVVPPSEPRAQLGIYWGYRVRVARGISRVLKEGPYKVRREEGGYAGWFYVA